MPDCASWRSHSCWLPCPSANPKRGGGAPIVPEPQPPKDEQWSEVVEKVEIEEVVKETLETRDEEGNLVLGGFPKTHRDAIIWHHTPTQEELDRPISAELMGS